MHMIRPLLLIAFAVALLGILVDSADTANATSQSLPKPPVVATDATPELDVYMAHKAEIDAVWQQLGDDASLSEAFVAWSTHAPVAVDDVPVTASPPRVVCANGQCRVVPSWQSSAPRRIVRQTNTTPRRVGWRLRRAAGRR